MPNFYQVCRSTQFTFLVGDEKTPIQIHSAIVKDHSKPLTALISNGIMKESTDKVAVLADVEPEVFTAFCEYAYKGTYTSPFVAPEKSPITTTLLFMSNEFKILVDSLFDRRLRILAKHETVLFYEERTVAWSNLGNKFKELCGLTLREFKALHYGAEPSPVHGSPCSLFHAKLYVFSTKYLIEPLRQMCLSSIHRDLSTYMLQPDEVCDLLDYVYQETGPVEFDGPSPLRSLLILYVASRMSRYSSDRKFSKLLRSNGEIGADLIQKLAG